MIKLKCIFYLPLYWLLWILFSKCKYKNEIWLDFLAFECVNNPSKAKMMNFKNKSFFPVYRKFMGYREFRTLFWFRIGWWGNLFKWLFPKEQTELHIDVPRDKVKGGLYLQHGYCTDLSCRSIGSNCWINQKVTIGYKGNGCPTIGDNVRIGVGANIIGEIFIGNNCVIGAGTTVVKSVPPNTLVVGQTPRLIQKNEF